MKCMFLFGPGCESKTERCARAKAKQELRRNGFRWHRGARRWTKDNGYGLINYQQRWIVLMCDGEGVKISDVAPARSRARQAWLAEERRAGERMRRDLDADDTKVDA